MTTELPGSSVLPYYGWKCPGCGKPRREFVLCIGEVLCKFCSVYKTKLNPVMIADSTVSLVNLVTLWAEIYTLDDKLRNSSELRLPRLKNIQCIIYTLNKYKIDLGILNRIQQVIEKELENKDGISKRIRAFERSMSAPRKYLDSKPKRVVLNKLKKLKKSMSYF